MIATATINGSFGPRRQHSSSPLRSSSPTKRRRATASAHHIQPGKIGCVVDGRKPLRKRRASVIATAMGAVKYNLNQWVEDNKAYFLPPICNKMMHSDGQLKVFCVGGPNVRPDYHLEEGEEFMYMLRGDMLLKVVEHGKVKDVVISEGEVFLLPGRIPHSPQRRANTVGLVIERERTQQELDCMRFYTDESCQEILYERWLQCDDLTQKLANLLNEFMASEEHRTRKPGPKSFLVKPAYEPDGSTTLEAPFNLNRWLEKHRAQLDQESGKRDLFGQGHQTTMVVLGNGTHGTQCPGTETFLWQLKGSASVTIAGRAFTLAENDTLLVPTPGNYTLVNQPGGRTLATSMPPKRTL
ncbi:3-hydroxyanthranilate 3,4-dioxygenase [Rhipicephalus sanguineus]|uniref:3-hydroxyanthranilate 3,4-dioxygenase n=1 Tax=Rhipicephalus sanguineus TaxID=34632 RepID=A0A9D4PW41_RHISA|nr:3-hydroxyanthranilate 3,4-dioxygenase [Rhipicephalus sanguineus]KAH7956889.1 hypothetical protein HPB52_013467 [Rhipicephalus sanguineus]